MSERELGRIVAAHMNGRAGNGEGFDVVGPQPDPERPPVIVIQEMDHEHDNGLIVRDYDDLQSGDEVVCLGHLEAGDTLTKEKLNAMLKALPATGHDVFKPWPLSVDEQLAELEHERTRALAKDALARMDQHLPLSAAERKGMPVATGFIDYFPDAVAAVATLSRIGNDQHNPGTPLHWDRSKSGDESDALMRHFLDRGSFDNDGVRHSVKVAWRAMALLQKEIEAAKGKLEPVFK